MDREKFNTSWAELLLVCANSDRVTPEMQEIYWRELHEIPNTEWQAGYKKCLGGFFPTINELGVAAIGEQKEQVVTKCDPWRRRQNYQVTVPSETWQWRLERRQDEERAKLEAPKMIFKAPKATEGGAVLQQLAKEPPAAEPKETLTAKTLACVGCGEMLSVPMANLWQTSAICPDCNKREAAR